MCMAYKHQSKIDEAVIEIMNCQLLLYYIINQFGNYGYIANIELIARDNKTLNTFCL